MTLTPTEIIRLNVFGCRVEHNPSSAKSFQMQRCAILDDIVFYEPTIGHKMWLDRIYQIYDCSDDNVRFIVDSFGLSMPYEELPKFNDKKSIEDGIIEMREKLAKYTYKQIRNCLDYVLYGNDAYDGEEVIRKRDDDDEEDIYDYDNFSIEYGFVKDGIVNGVDLSIDDMKRLTSSELQQLIDDVYQRKMLMAGRKTEISSDKYRREYWQELDRVKQNAKTRKDVLIKKNSESEQQEDLNDGKDKT